MTLRLTVATHKWHAAQTELLDAIPGLVPVAKGNGYGFGLDGLAREATRLRAGTLAVGTAHEVSKVRLAGWRGDVVVLNPWRPDDLLAKSLLDDHRVITTVSRAGDVRFLAENHPGARVLLELDTSMHRHGMRPGDLDGLELGDLHFDGWSIHLPASGSLAEAEDLSRAALRHTRQALWLSHLSVADYRKLRIDIGVRTHMRVGTRLWLGTPDALTTTATVLDVHPVKGGQRLGYHQVKAPRDGFIVVASGGTAHGIALAAPVPQRSLKQRATTVADGLLRATGQTLSPFIIAGKKRPFAEPPHMHSSMLFVAGADPGVDVGDDIPVTCRMTTTHFDEIVWA